MATNTAHSLVLHNGKTAQPLQPGQAHTVKVQAGGHYRIVKHKDGKDQLLDNVLVKRVGEDLQFSYADRTQVILEDYYIECKSAAACDVTLPGQDANGYRLSGENTQGAALGDGSMLVYAHGSQEALMAMAHDNSALQSVLAGFKGNEITYLPNISSGLGRPELLGVLGSGLGIAAAAGGGGSDGGETSMPTTPTAPTTPTTPTTPTPPTTPIINTVTGTVVAGPTVADHNLSVVLFQADGITKLGEAALDANGTFTFTVTDYVGVVIARVVDVGDGPDYLDEATNIPKDLNADLFSAGVVSGNNTVLTLSINALTTLAYQKMGTNPSASTVEDTNTAIATAFGLTGLTSTPVIATNSSSYNPDDGLSNEEKYGAVLAALSGADANNGGNTQTVLDELANSITISGASATLGDTATNLVINGAITADANVTGNVFATNMALVNTPLETLSNSQLEALTLEQLADVSATEITTLSPTQIAAIAGDIAALSTTTVTGLNAAQIAAIAPTDLAAFNNTQLGVLTATQLTSVSAAQVGALSPAQITALAANVAALPVSAVTGLNAAQVAAIAPAALAALSNTQLGALTATQMSSVTAAQVGALSPAQITALADDVTALPVPAIAGLSAKQVAAIAPADLATFSNTQLGALTATQLVNVSATQVDVLSPAQIAALGSDINGLSNTALASLNVNQTAALAPTTLTAFTPEQLAIVMGPTPPVTVPPPTVTSTVISTIAITSATGIQNSTLNAGDVVSVTVTLSAATTVSGTPQLVLTIGGTTVQADYASGSGTTALVFTYTIQAAQADANGISIAANSLDLNNGTLTDGAGNAVTLTHTAITDNSSYLVDTTAPTVSSIAATSATGGQNSTLNAGDVVSVTVTMSEATTVTGTPQLALNIGGTTVQADYHSGSGTTALVFTYTIQAAQTDANGISIDANSLALNGGTLTDAAGNAATLTHASVANNSSYLVDTTAPTVSSIAVTSATGGQNSTLNAGDVVSVTVTMSEATTVTGTPQLALNIGGTIVQADYHSGSGTTALVFTYTIQAAQTDANGISIDANSLALNGGTLNDAAGNAATLTHASVANNSSYLVDTSVPTLSSSTPADNATAVAASSNIVLTFSENVVAGSGNIVISNGTGDTRTIAVGDATQVTISNNTVTINPSSDLLLGSAYHVQMASGVLLDMGGNAYAGIADATALNFATSESMIDLSTIAAGTGGFVINGQCLNDYTGISVSDAGDINGDGLADVIVGAMNADPGGRSNAGSSYVVFGRTDTTAINLSDVAAGTGGFVIAGHCASDRTGFSVSGAGDINGDGLADLIVGAYNGDPSSRSNAGRSYVVFGRTDTTAINLSDVAAGTGGFVINGHCAADYSGKSVVEAGDVNGDGLADLIVGASRGDPSAGSSAGRSYVVFGQAGTTAIELSAVAAGTSGFVINGQCSNDQSGMNVATAGDVNGDGLADLIVGALYSDPAGGSNAGRSYIVFGQTGTTAINLSDVAAGTGGFVINGHCATDYSGNSVANAGDVNGDGLADLIVGARGGDPAAGTNAGRSYVIFGQTGTAAVNLSDVTAGTGGFVINGHCTGDQSGFSVAGAGDINGDGLADLIVGAKNGDPSSRSDAGRSYVVFGQTGTTAINLSDVAAGTGGFVITGHCSSDQSGGSVSSAGDINGDGLADLIVGAKYADPASGANAGCGYVIFGSTTGAFAQTAVDQLGTSGADALTGTTAAENLVGGAGDDILTGGGGSDVIIPSVCPAVAFRWTSPPLLTKPAMPRASRRLNASISPAAATTC